MPPSNSVPYAYTPFNKWTFPGREQEGHLLGSLALGSGPPQHPAGEAFHVPGPGGSGEADGSRVWQRRQGGRPLAAPG